MKLKSWILTGILFLTSCGAWAGYVISRHAFLNDLNAGVHAYLAGNFLDAEQHLVRALARRPRDARARELLVKTLIERSFAQYHQKDFTGAVETLEHASRITPTDEQTQQALSELRQQLSASPEKRPLPMEQVLNNLYHELPDQAQPSSLESVMEHWIQKSQANQEMLLKRFWDHQERWLAQLEQEKDAFKKILYGGLALFGCCGIVLLVCFLGVLHAYFGRRGVFSRLLDDHYRRLVAALPVGTQVLLGPPVSLMSAPETKQLDFIEAEITAGSDAEESHRRLETLLEGENPWVRARAAKLLHQLNPKLGLEELRLLVNDPSQDAKVSGMWALAELATPESLMLLAPLAYSPVREIQQGAIRSLLQLQSKENLSAVTQTKLNQLLSEIRTKTGWVF